MRLRLCTDEIRNRLVGRRVVDVAGSALTLDDGSTISCGVEGECCSHSVFTDIGQFSELAGTIIHDVEERRGKSHDGLIDPPDAECVAWAFLVFTTNRGHVTIDWRNESNGYYCGYVVWQHTGANP